MIEACRPLRSLALLDLDAGSRGEFYRASMPRSAQCWGCAASAAAPNHRPPPPGRFCPSAPCSSNRGIGARSMEQLQDIGKQRGVSLFESVDPKGKASAFRKLIEDLQIEQGGCRVEVSGSEVDATLATRWHRVIEAIGTRSDWLDTPP